MREILTFIAAVLVVALTAALIGPYFVNWTAERGLIEARLSSALGARVHIGGPVSLTLLPTPSLSVADVAIESLKPGGPSLAAKRADFELAVTALMRGEIQFLRADVERPTLRVSLDSDGAVSLPTPPADLPSRLDFENVGLRNATLIVERGSQPPWRLEGIDMQAVVGSLTGPFSGSGSIGHGAQALHFHFATEALKGASLSTQAQFSMKAHKLALSLSGALAMAPAGTATQVRFQGEVSASGLAGVPHFQSLPFALEGPVTIDAQGASVDKATFRLGAETTGLEATASGRAGFGAAAPIDLSLAAKQVDADRFLASLGTGAGPRLVKAIARTISGGAPVRAVTRPLHIAVSAPLVTIGGEAVSSAAFEFASRAGSPPQIAGSFEGPGGLTFSWRGGLVTGPAAEARGRLSIAAADVKRVADWIAPVFPRAAARLRTSPFQTLGLAGRAAISAVDFDGRDLELTADASRLRGSIAYTAVVGGAPARLFADLRSHALDLDSLPDLLGSAKRLGDMDLDLSLDARAVRLAHFGQGVVDAGRVRMKLRKVGARLTLDAFDLSNLGGASLSASGWADHSSADLNVSLTADRLDELAKVVNRVAPGPWAEALAARAVALSPARLQARLEASRGAGGALRPTSFTLKGTASGASVVGSLRPDSAKGSRVGLTFDLSGPDSSVLVRQLGLQSLPISDTGPGQIDVRAQGDGEGALKGAVAASLAGADLSFTGSVKDWTSAPKAQGAFSFTSQDAAPFLRLMTFILPDASQALPLSLRGNARAEAGALALSNIRGSILGDRLSGELRLKSAAQTLDAQGSLSVDALSLPTLASFVLGPPPPQPRGAWSTAKFAPGLAAPPNSHLQISVDRFDLGAGLTARNAKFQLAVSSGLVALSNATMTIGGGALTGDLSLRRDGANASLFAKLDAHSIAIEHSIMSGVFSGHLSFAATGASLSELADGFAGGGSLTAARFSAPRAAPDALPRLLLESDEENFKIDSKSVVADLAEKLDGGAFRARDVVFDVAAAGGAAQLTSEGVTSNANSQVDSAIALSFDLRSMALKERIDFTAKAPPSDWPEKKPPTFGVVWRQPASGAPTRTIRADALIADLSARAAAREAQAISEVGQDIDERAFFLRRMKGLEFMRRRAAEVASWKSAQARQKAQAEAAMKAQASGTPLGPPTTLVPSPAPPSQPLDLSVDPLSAGRY